MPIEIRSPEPDELRAAMGAALTAFAEADEEADWERERVSVRPERAVAAYDDGAPVGFSASYEFELTVPGGTVPTAGVTWVGVMPTHRRRGILRSFMERLLADAQEHGEPLAALYASEAAIYGRFGFGVATRGGEVNAESNRIRFRDEATAAHVRLVDEEEAYAQFAPLYERLRADRPGMLTRNEHWWRRHRLADYEHRRAGASRRFNALLELDGGPAAYAVYRVKDEWEAGYPRGEVHVVEAVATTPEATRELWRYLINIDLTTRVKQWLFDPASPLFLQILDPRALHLSIYDGLWLRLVDVEDALRRRSYHAEEEDIVLRVRDELLPDNEANYRVGRAVARTKASADLSLHVTDLASAYLGAFSFAELAAAGRVDEERAGALVLADRLFSTPLPPYCPEVF